MSFEISPYKFKGSWVFDDPKRGLDKEAFVQGADKILDIISRGVKDSKDGFRVIFSVDNMEAPYSISWVKEEYGGNWYVLDGYNVYGWLCPALFKYFPIAPKKIYIDVNCECLATIWVNKLTKLVSFKKPNVMPS